MEIEGTVLGDAVSDEQESARAKREAAAQENRERMPETARIVAEWRRVFGPGVKARYAYENGIELGKRGPEGVPITPLQMKGEK